MMYWLVKRVEHYSKNIWGTCYDMICYKVVNIIGVGCVCRKRKILISKGV